LNRHASLLQLFFFTPGTANGTQRSKTSDLLPREHLATKTSELSAGVIDNSIVQVIALIKAMC
jgi:hypothetical protein